MSASAPAHIPANALLSRMVNGAVLTQAIATAAELGVADHLKEHALTAAELASRIGANADGLHRILRALASTGIFQEDAEGRFAQTELSNLLRSDVPGSQRAEARMTASPWFWKMLAGMQESARTGAKYDWGGFAYFAEHPAEGDIFNQAMSSHSAAEIGPVLASYAFEGIGTLMDVGGGYGALLSAVLAAHPGMRGILFDAPGVVEKAKAGAHVAAMADRCMLEGGSFFEGVPAGADAIMMKHIIHDWSDDDSRRILKTCHAALPVGGKLLIIESIIRPGNDPAPGKMLDLIMLMVGGRERTEAQFRSLLTDTGFEVTKIVETPSPVAVIEARKR